MRSKAKGLKKGLCFSVIGGIVVVIIIILAIAIPAINRPVPYFEESIINIAQPAPVRVPIIPYIAYSEGDTVDVGSKFDESYVDFSFFFYRVANLAPGK